MSLWRVFIVYCFLFNIVRTNEAHLHSPYFPQYEKMNSIMIRSYIFEAQNPIIVSSNLENIIYNLLIDKFIPIILIDSKFEADENRRMFLPKIPTYILSTIELQTTIRKMKSSLLWTIHSRFFIVEVSKDCDNAWSVLQFMWKMNLLSSLFICQDIGDSLELYTYNPYANYAPYLWQQVKTVEKRDDQWTLYKLLVSQDSNLSDVIFFEKTKYLNGSKITAGAITRPESSINPDKAYNIDSIIDKLPFFISELFMETLSSLNVTPVIYYIDITNAQKIKNQTLESLFQNLANDTFDIALNLFPLVNRVADISFLYPRYAEHFLIMTRHTKEVYPLDDIQAIFSTEVIILSFLILFIALITFLFSKKMRLDTGLLEVLRMILSMSVLSKFHKDSLRIFFVSVLFFVALINANYQSRMSAYSTAGKRDAVSSIADLQNLKYSIYMNHFLKNILGVDEWRNDQKKYVFIRNDNCYRYVIGSNGSLAACIGPSGRNLPLAFKYNLNAFFDSTEVPESAFIRKDWPLEAKFNEVFTRFTEAGIFNYFTSTKIYRLSQKLNLMQLESGNQYRVIILSDLTGIFLFLLVSLLISGIVFIVELHMLV